MLQSSSLPASNPVYMILNEIFHLCEDLCTLLEQNLSPTKVEQAVDKLDERFGNLIDQLINLLVGLKAAPSTTPLLQLLLRLDFNHWFSLKKKRTPDQ